MLTVVTGASGHVGANLVRALLQKGRTVRAVVREDTRSIDGLEVEKVKADVLDPDSLEKAFSGAEIVYHCAANIVVAGKVPEPIIRVNTHGPMNVAEAALKNNVRRLIHFSSIHAISEYPLDEPVKESNGLVKDHERALPYSRSKAIGQHNVLGFVEKGLDVVVVNPSSVIGRHDYKLSHMGETIRDMAAGRLPMLVPGGYDFVDVRDLVETAIAAETKGRTGEAYLASGHYASVRELAELVHQGGGKKPPAMTCPLWVGYMASPFAVAWGTMLRKRPRFCAASLQVLQSNARTDNTKARTELGHEPRPLAETAADTVAWWRGAREKRE
jgi:dihydroflavonol-4-reductase